MVCNKGDIALPRKSMKFEKNTLLLNRIKTSSAARNRRWWAIIMWNWFKEYRIRAKMLIHLLYFMRTIAGLLLTSSARFDWELWRTKLTTNGTRRKKAEKKRIENNYLTMTQNEFFFVFLLFSFIYLIDIVCLLFYFLRDWRVRVSLMPHKWNRSKCEENPHRCCFCFAPWMNAWWLWRGGRKVAERCT